MTAYWCILVAALLPYVWTVIAKSSGDGRFDNSNPRQWLGNQDKPRVARANAAQMNAFEAFAPFAAGVIVAQLAGVEPDLVTVLSLVFVAARILHGVCYLANRATLRSLFWAAGFACVVWLLVAAALHSLRG